MHWFFIALIAPFLWSFSNHIDKYLVDRYLNKIRFTSFIITTAMLGALLIVLIFIFKPDVVHVKLIYALLLISSGIFSAVYLFPYYRALALEEASIVVPMFQMIPIVGFILAYFFLGEHLSLRQILAGIVIIAGSLGLSLEFSEKIRLKGKVFFLMFLSSFTISIGVLLYKFAATTTGYWSGIFWQQIGIALFSLALLLKKSYRENFINVVLKQSPKFVFWEGLNEVISQAASLIFSYLYLFVPIALVQLVGSVQPLFVLIIGITASIFAIKLVPENIGRKFLTQKVIFVLLILLGSYLLFQNL